MTGVASTAVGAAAAVAVAGAIEAIATAADRPDDVQRAAQRVRIGQRRAASLAVLARKRLSAPLRAKHAALVEGYDAALSALDAGH